MKQYLLTLCFSTTVLLMGIVFGWHLKIMANRKNKKKGEKKMTARAAWNKDKTKSVVLSKLKEFTITDNLQGFADCVNVNKSTRYTVRGWYNENNHFYFGDFATLEEAQNFLNDIHKMF